MDERPKYYTVLRVWPHGDSAILGPYRTYREAQDVGAKWLKESLDEQKTPEARKRAEDDFSFRVHEIYGSERVPFQTY